MGRCPRLPPWASTRDALPQPRPQIDASPPSLCLHGLKHLFGAGGGREGEHSIRCPNPCFTRCLCLPGWGVPVPGPHPPPLTPLQDPIGSPGRIVPGDPARAMVPPTHAGGSGLPQCPRDPRHRLSCRCGRRCHRRAPSPCPGRGERGVGGAQSRAPLFLGRAGRQRGTSFCKVVSLYCSWIPASLVSPPLSVMFLCSVK